jgi:hypothetical protein
VKRAGLRRAGFFSGIYSEQASVATLKRNGPKRASAGTVSMQMMPRQHLDQLSCDFACSKMANCRTKPEGEPY